MPKVTPEPIKGQIKKAFMSGVPIDALVEKFNVGERTLRRWVADENWQVERETEALIDRHTRPRPPSANASPAENRAALTIADQIITTLEAELCSGGLKGAGVGACATALLKWVEFKERATPVTVGDLVELIADHIYRHDISIRDFVAALKRRHDENPNGIPGEARERLDTLRKEN